MNILEKEHLTPEFLKKNPQHTVPTLDDNGNILWDSHAICTYLIGKYATDDSLYPKDLYERAKVDQRLHFDSGILFPRLRAVGYRIFFEKAYDFLPQHIAALQEAYDLTEKFLETDQYMVGNRLTLADLACVTTITQIDRSFLPLDNDKYPKIRAWLDRLAELPYFYDLNTKVLDELVDVLASVLQANKTAAGLE